MQPKLMFSVFDLMGAFSMIFAEPRPESKEEEDEDENQAPSSSSLVLPPQLIRKIEFNSSTEVKYKSFHDTYICIFRGLNEKEKRMVFAVFHFPSVSSCFRYVALFLS